MTEVMSSASYRDGVRFIVDETAGKKYCSVNLGAVDMAGSIEWRYRMDIDWPIVVMALTEQKLKDHETDLCRQFREEQRLLLEVRITRRDVCQLSSYGTCLVLAFMST